MTTAPLNSGQVHHVRALVVEGVRIYRVDAGDVTGTLWEANGTELATGQFSPFAGPGWQDLIFTQPVQITPGTTYVASYLAPNADYAYEHYFFATSALTVGPITAKQSIAADGNGVYCYVGHPLRVRLPVPGEHLQGLELLGDTPVALLQLHGLLPAGGQPRRIEQDEGGQRHPGEVQPGRR